MSIHKLTAGSGYDYLTRQVAALDATDKGHVGLASYYTARGETPGIWMGSGLAGVGGLRAGDAVTAEQMQALFGTGYHPLAAQRQAALEGPDLTVADYAAAGRLGAPFKVYTPDLSPFRVEVASRIAALNTAAGLPSDWPVPATERARVRTEVGREFFRAEHGRDPVDDRELAGQIAKDSRPKTQAVAGFDLTFSPVKSVSALWAVADPATAAAIETAHRAAVRDALTFIEQHALFTRTGANGLRKVDVRGLVATAFTHRDSRAGDPDLHTHVAVANKVQTLDGRWLSIAGQVLFKATVTASETYNTALEQHLRDTLGIRFSERPNPDRRLRPVREIIGVHPDLNARWSARRAAIDVRRGELAAEFQRSHGRPPTPVEILKLAQQATLETRDAKHEPRTLAEQRATWADQAADVLGGIEQVWAMVHTALHPDRPAGPAADAAWLSGTADRILTVLEGRRSTWQVWHVRAEAQRQIRSADIPTAQTDAVVDRLTTAVLRRRSVPLTGPYEDVREPRPLRRVDGASVYTTPGPDLFTSRRILHAEQRLLAAAGRRDGWRVDGSAVDLGLLAATANGLELNAGQMSLVASMATSGSRLQLAIAPAGAGKTTAMRALAAAWTEGGGTVIGLAPSATAAGQLRDQIGGTTDTLAKLTWAIHHHEALPEWAHQIGRTSLVIVDEAGMADTLSLDAVVGFVVGRGGSVRLIGDDQQLAAIGAGGVLRDIQTTHGAVRLTELLRFTDPAEAAATLALRDGQPEALGFHLDQHRIHVGDLTTITDDVFAAWSLDRQSGVDAIMLAPTRDLTAQLNQRARQHRLTEQNQNGTDRSAVLADGNQASAGELVISRSNDRRLRLSATDWVKNGDRWTVSAVTDTGGLQVRHARSGLHVTLPATYVAESVELGYATTVHAAQGVSVDTMHGIVSGAESRQQLYTMATRGRAANHLYVQVVGDGDPHSVVTPTMVRPVTATDLLEDILARDETPTSATTLTRDLADPARRLGEATGRYVDALHVAAEDTADPAFVAALETNADQIVPGLVDEPAWPALRSHLLLLNANGIDPLAALQEAASIWDLGGADDQAAVLDWRLDDTGRHHAGPSPLPWIPAIPDRLAQHPGWGPYLTGRSELVRDLTAQVRHHATDQLRDGDPPDGAQTSRLVSAELVGDLAVWRAAMGVEPSDQRPTGPIQLTAAARAWQQHLDRALNDHETPALREWGPLLDQAGPDIRRDPFTPTLAGRLAALTRNHIDAVHLLHRAVAEGPLPDEDAAAALWWRMQRHLTPVAVAVAVADRGRTVSPERQLTEVLGMAAAEQLQASRWWPALVAAVDRAQERGWPLDALLAHHHTHDLDTTTGEADRAGLDLLWRATLVTDPVPNDQRIDSLTEDGPPDDMWDGVDARPDAAIVYAALDPPPASRSTVDPAEPSRGLDDRWLEADLAVAAMVRSYAGPLEPTDADAFRMVDRAIAWQESPVSRDRIIEINQLTQQFFADRYPHSWARSYLTGRFGQDLTGDPRFQPGYAPAGWTRLVDHLHQLDVTDQEMVIAGVATTASTGRLIDRFRDRVTFPIIHIGDILGFVGRRHPDTDHAGPKYLNTADTALFHKGAQLYGAHLLATDPPKRGRTQIPVLVEGPMDAIAVTLAGQHRYIGVAPLGTSLTDEQATQLAAHHVDPIVATDNDPAGQTAAERDYWILTPHGLDPRHAHLPSGMDPADLLTKHGPFGVVAALAEAQPLGEILLGARLTNINANEALSAAAQVVAARPPRVWDAGSETISSSLDAAFPTVRHELLERVRTWNDDPRLAADRAVADLGAAKRRTSTAVRIQATPTERWAALADRLDPRLTRQDDWAALANLIQAAHTQGHDIPAILAKALTTGHLDHRPAQDLRYRLVAATGIYSAPAEQPPRLTMELHGEHRPTGSPPPTPGGHRSSAQPPR